MLETKHEQKETTRISVLVSHYRAEAKLRRCLESLSLQSEPFHLIILNDDPSVSANQIQEIVERLGISSALILSDGTNQGQANAYRRLISEVRTEYLAFLNQDDQWVGRDYLREAIDYLDAHPEASAVSHRWALSTEDHSEGTYREDLFQPSNLKAELTFRRARSFNAPTRTLRTIGFVLRPSDLHFHGVVRASCAPAHELEEFRILPSRQSNLVYPYCFSLLIQGQLSVMSSDSLFVNEIQREKSYRRVPLLLLGVRRVEVALRCSRIAWNHRKDGSGPVVAALLAVVVAPVLPFLEVGVEVFCSKKSATRSSSQRITRK